MAKRKKMSGKLLMMIVLALVMLLGMMPMSVFAESGADALGNDTENATAYAVFDSTTGTLTFKKSAEVPDSTETTTVFTGVENTSYPMPWSKVKNDVVKVVFEDVISPKSTSDWFYGMKKLKTVENFKKLDLSSCSNMSYTFGDCESLTSIDLSGLNASGAADMHNMFASCTSLTSVDLSGLDISNVTDISYMFYECYSLKTIDFSKVKASSVDDISYIFRDCRTLTSAILPSCAPSYMDGLFENCWYLSQVDLSGLDCSNAPSYSGAFDTAPIQEAKLGENFSFGDSEFSSFGTWHKEGSDKQYTASELAAEYNGSTMAGTYLFKTDRKYFAAKYDPFVINGKGFKNVLDVKTSLPTAYAYCINHDIHFYSAFCNGYNVASNDEILPWLDPGTEADRDSSIDVFKGISTVLYYGFGNENGVIPGKNVSLQEACGIDDATAIGITQFAIWYYSDGYDSYSYYKDQGGGEAKYYAALTGRDSEYELSFESIPNSDQLDVTVLSPDGKVGNYQNLAMLTKKIPDKTNDNSSNDPGTNNGDSTNTAGSQDAKSSAPGTGDNSHLTLWFALAAASMIGIVAVATTAVRKKKFNR